MKKNKRKMIVGAMLLATACHVTAFANDAGKETVGVSALHAIKIDATKVELPQYIKKAGKIEKITKQEGFTRVEIGKQTDGLVMNLLEGTMVLDRKTNQLIRVADLEEGMEVCAVIPANSPMTLSLPPITNSVVVLIANANDGNMVVGQFDKDLINAEAQLKLNIDEKTIISDTTGAKKVFTAEDVKEQNALVFYDVTTKSIPAQTVPCRVLILVEKEVVPVVDEKKEVGLREVAEKAGFKVTWIANDRPVIVEKEGLKIEITLGQSRYTKNGETMNSMDSVQMKEDKMIVCGDIADWFQ